MLYELPRFEHVDVRSLKEALSWLHKFGYKARAIAGGTDLLSLMKDRVEGPALPVPQVLVNIKKIPEMNQIVWDKEVGLRIGAAVTLNSLQISDLITEKFNILAQAARQVGTTQIRNMGTIGGNLCQRPRCMYFRHPDFLCYKKGGTICYALTGEHKYYHSLIRHGRCVAAHLSDMAPALVALQANAIITGFDGGKRMPLQKFFVDTNRFTETILQSDELLTEIQVPTPKAGTFQLFHKQRIRHSSDFPLSSVAIVGQMAEGRCGEIKIAIGGIAPFPYVPSMAEEIVRGKELNETLICQAVDAAVERAHPLPLNRYKIDVTKALIRRALTSLGHEAGHG